MVIVAVIFGLLAAWIAAANIVGCVSATKDHGYSCVPLLSLLFCIIASIAAGDVLGYWLLVPAIVDPGTLVLLLVPCYLVYRKLSSASDKDYSLDGKDRTEWEQAWASMPHRRLLTPPKIDVAGSFGSDLGEVVSVTISEDPPEFSSMARRPSETCPVCGATTVGTERLPASLHPTLASGFCYGLGVWVHLPCFEGCPDAVEPTPIPW